MAGDAGGKPLQPSRKVRLKAVAGRLRDKLKDRAPRFSKVAKRRTTGRRVARENLAKAIHQNKPVSKRGLLDRAFALAFQGLVYPQIWEDPVIDMEALAITPDCHIMTIASGGCNMMSYLIADPAHITAVDLNRGHIALNQLKLTAARTIPDHETFYRFFGLAKATDNLAIYDRYIQPALDAASRDYWESRDLLGRRRIKFFAKNIYRYGLLGTFIGWGHLIARLHGKNPALMLDARTLEEQRQIFDQELAPLFRKRFVRWLVDRPVALYGLGIPPAQFKALASSGDHMADVLLERLERLATGFELDDNYFAWQAFGRRYARRDGAPVPPYLQKENFAAVKARADRVEMRHINMIDYLRAMPAASLDRYVLLDAQDWMNEETLTTLWTEITRTAKPGARVIFRTAAEASVLPGRIPDTLLARWSYDEALCKSYTRRDRSSIYGGFHLYILKDAA
jgi:S-adenosylmethionine-diacylglycerol 3-amino-3-carboxypropyl transferase